VNIWILTQYYPPEFGGSALTMSQLARRLVISGQCVTVLTSLPNYPTGIIAPPYKGHAFYAEVCDGVQVERVWAYASPNKRARARMANQISFMLMAMLRGTMLPRPDVILVESHPLFVCLSGGWLRRIKRAPVVLNVSDLWPESAIAVGMLKANSPIVKIAERVERWAYHDAAYVVGMTEGVRVGIVRIMQQSAALPPANVTMLRFPVDLQRFRPGMAAERAAMRAQLGFAADAFVVAFPGNLSLQYNFDVMLNAAAALPTIQFLIAGGGSQAEYISGQVAARNLSNVTLTGIVSHDAMPGIWAASDVCLIALNTHPLFEGTVPAKLVEALAAGVPIVAAIRGEAQQLLSETGAGIVIALNDSAAAIETLRRLAEQPERRQHMSAAGRAYAEAHLSIEAVQRAFTAIFEQVVNDYK